MHMVNGQPDNQRSGAIMLDFPVTIISVSVKKGSLVGSLPWPGDIIQNSKCLGR